MDIKYSSVEDNHHLASGRTDRLRAVLTASKLDWAILTSPQSICYLTGFSSTGYYLPHLLAFSKHGALRMVLRDFEVPALKRLSPSISVAEWRCRTPFVDVTQSLIREISSHGPTRIGVEGGSNFMPYRLIRLMTSVNSIELVDIGDQVEALRRSKDSSELALIANAGGIAVQAMSAGVSTLQPGVSEKQVAIAMLTRMVEVGGDFPASYPYVYFGERIDLSMQQATALTLKKEDQVYLECGARINGYSAALIRTGALRPTEALRGAYNHARVMFETAFHGLRPGIPANAVDAKVREYVRSNSLEDYWLHRAGYSIGIGFAPGWGEGGVIDIRPDNDTVIPSGCVFHLVSLLCLPNFGFVGLSETVQVGETGAVSLTPWPRGILEVG